MLLYENYAIKNEMFWEIYCRMINNIYACATALYFRILFQILDTLRHRYFHK